jgi:hypothetical protein
LIISIRLPSAKIVLGEIEVTFGSGTAVTAIVSVSDLVASSVEVAVQLADPTAAGVKTPAVVIVPFVAV